ncbi:unnamed protein product [Mycena citricolor]|uniref:SB domain-containing protein n=1 Tax=Mycena citricolor TaxID=2018698 RepID=A0AAD2JVR2_9AGAR|nr:unnamed protein product [Mycena citricolor]
MLVRPGPHLDPSGRLGIEYLQQWVRKSEGCSVSGLVEAMQGEFGRSPPVYAKPHGPPVLPPKPMQTQSPAPGPSPAQIPSPALAAPAQAPPNYQLPPRPPPPPPPPNPTPYQPQPSFVPQQFAPQPQYPPAPPPPVVASPPIPNLLDADEAPALGVGSAAPPVPPNPQIVSLHNEVHAKLSSSLASLSTALALDAERLRAHQGALLAGEPAIRDEMARLEAVRDVCNGVVGRVGAVVSGAESWVNDVRGRGEPSVDELVCGVSIVGNQVVNLVAEDNAIEDTIFHLSKALNSGRIDLERFLRSTRLLAEEQFMKRALIEKINANMPVGQPAGY